MATDFKNLFPEDLYHSYIVEGDPDTVAFALRAYLEERSDIEPQSPDVICELYDSFTVDNSQMLKEWHSLKGATAGKKICIIGTKFINHDAERTLLKMIEEPGANTHFFIVVPNAQILLDTILSRAHIVKVNQAENSDIIKGAEEFFINKPKDRIEIISRIIEDHKDSVGSGAVRSSAIGLVNGLERIVYKKFQSDRTNIQIQFALEELSKAREYLSLPGASVKMILEHIALVL